MRPTLPLMACAVVALGIGLRLTVLQDATRQSSSPATGMPEDEALFQELLAAGLLQPRPDGGLERLPRDWLLQRAASGEAPAPDDLEAQQVLETRRRLLGELDTSAVGAIVEKQIDLWNQTRRLSAIRDDGLPGEEGTPSAWSAKGPRGRPLRTGRIVPETFGFVHDGVLRPGYSDWLATPGSTTPVTFTSVVTPRGPGPVTIQLVGEPIRVPPGARKRKLSGPGQPGCPEQPVAYQISLPARGPKPFPVKITALPSINCAARIHGLAIRLEQPEPGAVSPAVYSFRPVQRARPSGRYVIQSRDGKFLTDPGGHGRPTAIAERLGLLPLVGTGPGDSFSLSGMLAATPISKEGLDVRLTIDSPLQLAAREALDWGATRYGEDEWATERKAALIILDANDGAILAVAGHPAIPEGLSSWDLPAFSAAFPLRDPSSVLAWEVIDKHNTPGSTFKPVTALALMMERDANFQERIRPVLEGLDSAELGRATGLSFASKSYVAYSGAKPVPNFGGATLGRYAKRPTRDPRCSPTLPGESDDPAQSQEEAPEEGRLGLVQATQFSLNAWYARVALMMEQERIDDFARRAEVQEGERIAAPEMTLTRTARWLGIDDRKRLDLATNLPASAGLARHSGQSHDVLYPQLARSTLARMSYNENDWGARPLVMYTTALNGIGQTVSTSPLQMALAAAAIATGQRVRPHLLAAWNGVGLEAPERAPLDVPPDMLELLRAGMKAVTEVGTAPRAFPRPLACRVYGKTGTAEIDAARSYNSGWFIGWREGDARDSRTLAFACMSTHATGDYRFGGTACAPVVSRALQSLEAPNGSQDPG
jgi:cell division protein FtsI/penicillin-binding protein 2